MLGRKRLVLKYGNCFYIVHDYFYVDFFPEVYYYYWSWKATKFRFVNKNKKYILYEVD